MIHHVWKKTIRSQHALESIWLIRVGRYTCLFQISIAKIILHPFQLHFYYIYYM